MDITKTHQIWGEGAKKSLPDVGGDSKPETNTEPLSESEPYGLILLPTAYLSS